MAGKTIDKVFYDGEEYKIGMAQADIINMVYPVGSIYLSLSNSDPSIIFGGTWEKIEEGYMLMSSGENFETGDYIEAGLPNITGTLGAPTQEGSPSSSGAFGIKTRVTSGRAAGANAGSVTWDFDASRSSSVYGNSDTVQPPALVVNIWKRVS